MGFCFSWFFLWVLFCFCFCGGGLLAWRVVGPGVLRARAGERNPHGRVFAEKFGTHLLDLAVHDRHDPLEPVVFHNLPRLLGDRAALDANDPLGPRLCSKHAKDPGSAAHVQHGLALKEVAVGEDGVHVGARAHGVLEHLLVDACFVLFCFLGVLILVFLFFVRARRAARLPARCFSASPKCEYESK